MALTTKFISAVDVILNTINKDLYKNIEDYCFLETVHGDTCLVGDDGSLATVLMLDGVRKVVDDEEIGFVTNALYKKLKTSFKEEGHLVQFVFSRDKERTKSEIDGLLSSYKGEAKKMGMDAEFLFEEKSNHLGALTCHEENYIVLWSRPALITPALNKESEDLANLMSKYPYFEKGQNIFLNYKSLKDKHQAFVKSFASAFKNEGFALRMLNVKTATNKIRSSISSELTSSNWHARTHDSKKPVLRDNDDDIGVKEHDMSYFLYPSLKKQFIPDDFYRKADDIVKIGDKYVSSMFVDIPQDEPSSFIEFLKGVDDSTPFQMSFKIAGGGMSKVGMKKFLAAILSWMPNSNNKQIKEALEYYGDAELGGEAITKNNITLNTWANNLDDLSTRKSFLYKALQSWGSISPMFNNSDTYEGFFASVPAFTPSMFGNNFLDVMSDVLYMLPLSRQANIWTEGCIINRTDDGKLMPYQVASTLQASWNELIFAKPGSGKSVWSNYTNWSFIVTPKSDMLAKGKLPFIGIIDIGPSSRGLIKLLQMLLPASRHHEMIYRRLTNSEEDAINIFDTQLGCRKPNDKEREFITNFMTLLLTPAGKETPEGIDSMIANVVKEVYREYSDEKNPKEYEEYDLLAVDEKLTELEIDPKNRSWWWVVDQLFLKEEFRLARMAQKRAVPILDNCVKIANSVESIKSVYEKPIMSSTKETMIQYFNRVVAEIVNMYPLLNKPTELDLSDARVISLDLNDVAPRGDAAAKKQSSVFYMLARFVVTRNFFLAPNTPSFAPDIYGKYLKNKVAEHHVTPKRLCVDELHRTAGIESFRAQIKQDMREGRKWKLSVCLISQLLSDFDDEMIDLCNSKFILSGGDNYEDIVEKFDLNGEIGTIVRSELNGPNHMGVPFVVKFTTKAGEYTQFLYNTLSPIEMWAFSSTMEDVKMIERCEDIFGSQDALRVLAQSFPSGSITGKIEEMNGNEKLAHVEDPIGHLIEQLKKKHKDRVKL
jgi:intracellular multiplication protein IcmB